MTETYRKSQVLAVIKNYSSLWVPIHACRSFLKFGVSTFVRDALRCLGSVRERCQREQGARAGEREAHERGFVRAVGIEPINCHNGLKRREFYDRRQRNCKRS